MLIYPKKNLLALLCIGATIALSCKKNGNEVPAVKKGLQLTIDAKFGTILTDSSGKSLYMFASDVAGTANCTGPCEVVWPLYYSSNASTDLNLNAAEVATVTRSDGKKQTTYKGYPLYYYKDDTGKGDVKGDGIGGIWFVGKPDYSLMLANNQLTGLNGKTYLSTYAEGTGKTVYLTDGRGRTVYAFSPDKNNKNTFTTDAAKNNIWPVYEGDVQSLPSVISKDVVARIDVVTIGKKQLTYKGWPLYYFGQDQVRGDNKGVSVGPSPGFWPVIQLDRVVAPQ